MKVAASILPLCLGFALTARAQTVYYTPRAILTEFFPRSTQVSYRRIEIPKELKKRLEDALGQPLRKPFFTVYIAQSQAEAGPVLDGYAVLDDEQGQHQPISFAVKFTPKGAVSRQEVMVYRERYGDEVRDERFRKQFYGKTASDPLRPGEEIVAISGATISSRAMAIGVKRALLLLDALVLKAAPMSPAPQKSR